MPSALTLQAFWLGSVLARMLVTKNSSSYPVLSCLANKITSGKPMSTFNVLASNPRVIIDWLCKALLLNWQFCGKLVFLMQVWSTFIKDMNASATSIGRLQTSISRKSYKQLMLELIMTSSRMTSPISPNRVILLRHTHQVSQILDVAQERLPNCPWPWTRLFK